MLMRWLVNQYLRDAAEGKVRPVVGNLSSELRQRADPATLSSEPRTLNAEPSAAEFLPCDVVFVFALGIESGGLVDLLKAAEISRQRHGTERAGKLAGREVVIVESGVGQKAAARAT